MNAPFRLGAPTVREAGPDDRAAYARFLAGQPDASVFHDPRWLDAVAQGSGHASRLLLAEQAGVIVAALPLHAVSSLLFGRALVSTGFAVGGGIVGDAAAAPALVAAAQDLAQRLKSPTIELRGGVLPQAPGWHVKQDSHVGFVMPLAADDAAQLQAVPRKQRAELRKGLAQPLEIRTGNGAQDRAWHYRVYSESVRNLGTPVFPRRLFARMLDAFGQDADILTVLHEAQPVASVLSLYHGGAVMPYWGGGVLAARALRANDVMYYALMNHARGRGMDRFDFGRSKVDSGAYHFKRNWGFVPQPLSYAHWTADGQAPRDVNPLSPRYQAKIRLWQKLPLPLANLIGPIIARGLA
ncbi:FemAB family XrtA/PEP-CTERM system-associated protein [Novosphingobium sp. SG720]|uniref:FemAB family XrtA/PEP-CTERM system-associated protein n=1 Tax=Novosphingobium sp. SG720 TaxID=2586998 RepID=UPI001446CEF8|nr:FemAB family XrtA/PEP-CTERM system-associated protein [Novosphingobium sp. SG720]NKJ41422.1 FemAB-related protein (PEP-CTERM system-associated) [Novosphingobium sp. SG720]